MNDSKHISTRKERAMSARPKQGQSIPMAAVRVAGLVALVLVLFVLLPSAVVAKQARLLAGTFGAATSTAVDPYPLGSISEAGIAVDQSNHDLYVADWFDHRIEKFDSSGRFLVMFGKEVNKTAAEESRPEAERDICPAPSHSEDVCQAGVENSAPGGFSGLLRLSVDNSGVIGQQGNLYVADGGVLGGNLITKFDPEGRPIESWGDGGSGGTPNGQLTEGFTAGSGEVGDINVDPAGHLWVLTQAAVFEFSAAGFPATSWPAPNVASSSFVASLAANSKSDLYTATRNDVEEFSPAGVLLGQNIVERGNGFVESTALTVDSSTDNVYLGIQTTFKNQPTERFVYRYDSSCHPRVGNPPTEDLSCEPVEKIGVGFIKEEVSALAIDPSTPARTLFVAERHEGNAAPSQVRVFAEETVPDALTKPPVSPTLTSATLTGTVNPSGFELNEGATGCRFEWGETTAYGHETPCEQSAAAIGKGGEPVEVSAQITGLQAGHTYHYRLVGSNANDVNGLVDQPSFGQDVAFGPPVIEGASATDVAASEATLQVEIDPRAVNSRVRIEYVTQEQFDIDGFSQALSSLVRDIPATGVVQPPSFKLTGLVPHTVYRYRAVAESVLAEGLEAVVGTELAFTTEVAGSSAQLADGRAWELVSPPEKYGSRIEPIFETGVVQAAADGEGISYFANAPTEPEPQASGASSGVQVLSTRTPSGGWFSQDLASPHTEYTGVPVGPGKEYRAFSENLEYGFVNPFGPFDAAISPEASEQSAFRRTDYLNGDPAQQCVAKTMNCYRPLVTGVEGFANVPFGTQFGKQGSRLLEGPQFLYATPDGSRAIIESGVALTGTPITDASLYEWDADAPVAEQLRLVSVLPGTGEQPVKEAFLGYQGENMRNALSADGSRVVFTEGGHVGGGGSIKRLFLRDVSRGETVQVDRHELGCSKCESGEGHFQLASADGSRVLFTDARRLTANSGAVPGQKLDLYQCQIVESETTGELECALTDLTPKTAGGESADVLGNVNASEDASSVYFVANGVLSEEQNAQGEHATPGECITNAPASKTCNLYQSDKGRVSFIARLSAADDNDWSSLKGMPARVSPNGLWFAFMSQRSLTGYDNRDVATGQPAAEVYLYDAAADRILCASCDPTGARPHAIEYKKLENETIDGGDGVWSGGLVAANLPGWIGDNGAGTVIRHQPRYLSDSGRVFFNSGDALVPEDANGTQDVYEFELPGTGDCSQASQRFSANNGGCVSLISSGSSAQESAFLDASESGDDVFFLTSQRLVARDIDSAYDVYDARVDGGEPPIVKPVECVGDACQTPVVPPVDQAPGSLTFNGPGNIQQPTPKQTSSKTKHKQKPHKKKPRKRSHRRTGPKHGGHK